MDLRREEKCGRKELIEIESMIRFYITCLDGEIGEFVVMRMRNENGSGWDFIWKNEKRRAETRLVIL